MGDVFAQVGQYGPAAEQLRGALAILEALVRRQPYVARCVTARAQAHYKLAVLHRRAGEWALAENHCWTAVDEMALLASQTQGSLASAGRKGR